VEDQNSLWWVMNPSGRGKVFILRHYIDDSGGDQRAPSAVMGGPVFVEERYLKFECEWAHALSFYQIEPPIHMKEFARPHGRLACLSDGERRVLFQDLVKIINQTELYSLTASVDNIDFQHVFPHQKFRKRFSAIALAFLWCMILNYEIGKDHQGAIDGISYFFSDSPINSQIIDCYSFFCEYEVLRELEITEAIGHGRPKIFSGLQAADMIAWANRKKNLNEPFKEGFEPLELLTPHEPQGFNRLGRTPIHMHYSVKNESTRELALILGEPKRQKGKREALLPLIAQEAKTL